MFEPCRSVEFPGGVARYALLRSESPTDSTLLLDFGGPGISVLSGPYRLAEVRKLLLEQGLERNLLIVEEPWVTANLEASCASALASVSEAIETGNSQEFAEILDPCLTQGGTKQTWRFGFNPDDLAAVIAAITEFEAIAIDEILGVSFGSARAAYLNGHLDDASVSLISPYPIGAKLGDVLDERATTIETWIADAGADLSDFRDFRVASAAIAASYRGQDAFFNFAARIRDGTVSDREIDNLHRATWLTYSDSLTSPAYLAYLEEVCKLGEPASSSPSEDSPIRNVFTLFHAPCASSSDYLDIDPNALRVDCVVVNEDDAVVSPDLIAQSFAAPIITRIDPSVPHGWIGALTRCDTQGDS